MNKYQKAFKVVTVSSNTNSFGLYGMIILARDGEGYEIGVNNIHKKNKNDIVYLPLKDGKTNLLGDCQVFFEIPRKLPKAPKNVIDEVWTK